MAAQQVQVQLTPGTRFGSAASLYSWLRLPYSQPIDKLREAIDRLSTATHGLSGQPVPTAAPLTI